jgi:hypothetical protein
MFNNILILQMPVRLTCAWVPTGNLRNPLACIWAEATTRGAFKEASSSKANSGRMPLCA